MSCCDGCAAGSGCVASPRGKAANPPAVKIALNAGDTYGSAATPEPVQVYHGPVYLELWSYDADTVYWLERQRTGREGQRIVTEQKISAGPVSRRVVYVAAGERATVRAYARAVSVGAGWNDNTGRYSASTPDPYLLVLTYDEAPIEYGASSAAAVSILTSETLVAAHHARYLTIYLDPDDALIEVLDRGGNVVAARPASAYNVVNCSDPWVRVRVTNTGAVAINAYWIASVAAPGMV
jgi:hypothetical protein